MANTLSIMLLCSAVSQDEASTRIFIQLLGKPPLTGILESWRLDSDLVVRMGDGQTRKIATNDLDVVEFEQRPQPAAQSRWDVTTTDGSLWRGELLNGDDKTLVISTILCGNVTIPIEKIQYLQRRNSNRVIPPMPIDEDQLLLLSGAIVRGVIVKCDKSQLIFQDDSIDRSYPWTEVYGVVPAQTVWTELKGARWLVRLTDGTRITSTSASLENDQLTLSASATADSSLGPIPASNISTIEVLGGRRTWLGDIPPTTYEYAPYMNAAWPMRVDVAADGGPLRLNGRVYPRGLGLHSRCRVTWLIEDRFERFTAEAGLDDSAGSMGDADLSIFVDGRMVVEHRGLKKGQSPRQIDVDLLGAMELSIEVGYGRGGDVQDRVDLVRAALITKPGAKKR